MSKKREVHQWAIATFGKAKLGDVRRTKRVVKVATDLAATVGASPSRASGRSKAAVEGAYRFLRNESVDPAAMAESGFRASVTRAAEIPVILAVEDTTTLSYTHQAADQLGDMGGPEGSEPRGFFVHSALLLDAQSGATLGLADQQYWMRSTEARGQRHRRLERPYEEKESFKWQRTSECLRERLGEDLMAKTISVCDREADVYEYLCYKLQQGERFIVRASWDRCIEATNDNDEKEKGHLFDMLGKAKSYGRATTIVAQRGGRSGRSATLRLRALRVRLRRPERLARSAKPLRLGVNAVLAREESTPAGIEPLEWLLFTSEPINSPNQVLEVLHDYRLRWRIEDFHKAWKSGAGIERRRMQEANNLRRVAVILAFVAVRLLQLREVLEQRPEAPCDEVLSTTEWKVLWVAIEEKRPPRRVPTVMWAYHAIGRLGGWSDSKRTGRMGWESYWLGWNKLRMHVQGYETALLVGGSKM